jgi:predicted DNA-binding antitoxin AbrB/MazE fold protein
MNAIRAIYEDGHLRLLEPIDLVEGQEVEVVVRLKMDDAALRAALADLDIQWSNPDADVETLDEDALLREIETAFQGEPSLSQYIIEDRGH